MQIPVALIDCDVPENGYDQEVVNKVKDSMNELGRVLHPIGLQSKGERYQLLTGKNRLFAAQLLGWEAIEATVNAEGSVVNIRELQLHENLMRKNRDWPEDCALVAEWHQMRQEQKGKAASHRPQDGAKAGWSMRDTAKELERSLGSVSEDIALNKAILDNPHLAKIKDKSTALRLVKQAVSRQEREILATMPDDPGGFEYNQAWCGNSLDLMKSIPDESFDLCITDPPWSLYKDDSLTCDDSTVPVFEQIYRVLKPKSMLYMIVSTVDFINWTPILRQLGFLVQDYPIIWQKSGTITHGRRLWQYARDYEPIIVACKGEGSLTDGREMSAVLNFPSMAHQHMIHPHEKPANLIEKLIQDSTYPGMKVIDPFGGSGVVADTARRNDRKYLTIERNPEFFYNIQERLKK